MPSLGDCREETLLREMERELTTWDDDVNDLGELEYTRQDGEYRVQIGQLGFWALARLAGDGTYRTIAEGEYADELRAALERVGERSKYSADDYRRLMRAALILNHARDEFRQTASRIAGCDLTNWSLVDLHRYADLAIAFSSRMGPQPTPPLEPWQKQLTEGDKNT